MPTRSPSAYFISVMLHGLVVSLLLFLGYLANESSPAAPKILELVAGVGDNYGATEAPALGSPGGIKLTLPAEPQPAAAAPVPPAPQPPEPVNQEQAPPIKPAPLEAAAKPAKTAAKADQVPNFTKVMQRTENRRVTRLMAKYKKQLEAEQRRQQMSYDEYLKKHGTANAAQPDAEGIRQGVVGGSTSNKTGGAGGKALTREQGELLAAYFALLKARIKENHVPPEDVSDKLIAKVEFYLAADGSLSRVRIIQSSGSAIFDHSILEAFAHTRSIGPRPDGRGDTMTSEFRMRDEEGE